MLPAAVVVEKIHLINMEMVEDFKEQTAIILEHKLEQVLVVD